MIKKLRDTYNDTSTVIKSYRIEVLNFFNSFSCIKLIKVFFHGIDHNCVLFYSVVFLKTNEFEIYVLYLNFLTSFSCMRLKVRYCEIYKYVLGILLSYTYCKSLKIILSFKLRVHLHLLSSAFYLSFFIIKFNELRLREVLRKKEILRLR